MDDVDMKVLYTWSHHASALTVPNVWVEPGQAPQNTSQPRHSNTDQTTETRISWHSPQQVLLYLRDRS